MGTNSLITATGGSVIPPGDNNNINEAISTDVVPRNSSGAPTDGAGALGTSSYFWSAVYSAVLNMSASANMTYTSGPDTVTFTLGSSTAATMLETGLEPLSYGPRPSGSAGVDPGVMKLAVSSTIAFTSTSTNEDVTGSDLILTPKGGAALIGFLGVYNDGTGGGIYGTTGGERFKIKNVTAASDLTGNMYVGASASRFGFGGYTQLVTSIGGTVGVAQTLRAEAIDIGATISGVVMFALEI